MSRTLLLLKTACATWLISLTAIAGDAAPTHHLLLAVWDSQGTYMGDVIGQVKDGKVYAIADQNYEKFVAAHFKDRQYNLYSGGRPLGSITAKGEWRDQDPCGPYEASLSPDKSVELPSDLPILASDLEFKDAGYTRRKATAAERAAFLVLAADVYVSKGVSPAIYKGAKLYSLMVLEKGQQVLLAGSMRVDEPSHEDGTIGNTDSVFLIADQAGSGQFKRSFTWYNSGSENTGADRDSVDALDIDGDGTPEIVAQTSYYEGTGYTIYKKTGHGWLELFDYQYGC